MKNKKRPSMEAVALALIAIMLAGTVFLLARGRGHAAHGQNARNTILSVPAQSRDVYYPNDI